MVVGGVGVRKRLETKIEKGTRRDEGIC